MWWYDAGKPVTDPTLALIAEVWDRDEMLDPYLSWAINVRGLEQPQAGPLALSPEWTEWQRAVTAGWSPSKYPGFGNFTMGSDPLHLNSSAIQLGTIDESASVTSISEDTKNAVLTTRRADAWYETLAKAADALPRTDGSWKVQVIAVPIGYLGTFRKSVDTGRWYACEHSVHAVGAAPRRP